jgi:deoxyribose-phosphate aldolase
MDYNTYIDHTLLKPDASLLQIKQLCDETKKYKFMSVCVNPCFVKFCKTQLKNSNAKICTVIGFPLGNSTTQTKIFEAQDAIKNGADEIDMVINIS